MAVRRPPTTFSDEINAADLAANSVTASELADNAVDTAAIADDAVTNAKVGASAIGATELASNAVTTAKITDANITAAKVASSAITKEKIAAEAIEVKPHIKYGMLYPAMKDTGGTVRLSDGVTAHSGTVYGTVQSDGKSYYYTDIKGSKPIKDPRIGGHFGSQRHRISSLQLLDQETATHGSDVYSIDGREWARAVGVWIHDNGSGGTGYYVSNTNSGGSDFIEIVGYFSDANINEYTSTTHDKTVSVNGTVVGSNPNTSSTTTVNTPLGTRFVSSGSIVNLALGQTLGIHTLKIASVNGDYLGTFYDFELITQDTADATRRNHVNIPAQNVVSYGKRFSVGSATLTNAVHKHYNPFAFKTDGTTAWASGTHNGTSFPVGTGSSHNIDTATSLGLENWKHSSNYYKPYNGGRVVRWVANDGTIKTSVTVMPPNARSIGNSTSLANGGAKANASIANNTAFPTMEAGTVNDFPTAALTEVAKQFHYREFGNGAANGGTGATWADASMLSTDNDLSTGGAQMDTIAYVMGDGLTSISGTNVRIQNESTYGGVRIDSNSSSIFFTFIGTGIQTIRQRDNSTTQEPVTWAQNLPYGTHVLELQRDGSSDQVVKIDGVTLETNSTTDKYLIHGSPTFFQPKKPPIPDDACILADYMLMADFVIKTGLDSVFTSKGVLRKECSRDIFYNGGDPSIAINTSGGSGGIFLNTSNDAGAGDTNGTLTSFGTNYSVTGYDIEGRSLIDLNGSSATVTNVNTGSGHATFAHLSNDTTLGLNKFKIKNKGGGRITFAHFESATPIHTSSHYQAFETPYLNELVGGDRNMEQTNLIVTADGKSWDEVTRDTSYIGNLVVLFRGDPSASNDTDNTNSTLTHFEDKRGTHNALECHQKDWAIGYDRMICLKAGTYRINYHTSDANGGDGMIVINGVDAMVNLSNGSRTMITNSCVHEFIRGDTVQIEGAVQNGVYMQFFIERV